MKKIAQLLCIITLLCSFSTTPQRQKNKSLKKNTSINLRKLIVGRELKVGTIIPKTTHTYLSEVFSQEKVTISINKTKGRAKTKIEIKVLNKNGSLFKTIKFKFPNDKNALKKTWTIKQIKGKKISVTLKNTTTINKFNYIINCI